MVRFAWIVLGCGAVGLGAIGIVVGPILAAGPFVATLPANVSRHAVAGHGLRLEAHPFAELLPTFRLRMTWHGIHHRDAGHTWLRGLVADVIEGQSRS